MLRMRDPLLAREEPSREPRMPAETEEYARDGDPASDTLTGVRERVRTLVTIAATNGSTISCEELRALLPPSTFPMAEEVGVFVRNDRVLRAELLVIDGEVVPRAETGLVARRQDQRRLTSDRLQLAHRFVGSLGRLAPWIELAGISGSVAYGGTKAHDDIDFYLVTRPNRMWITFFLAMGLARVTRLRDPAAPVFCFNRLEEMEGCQDGFRENRDPLFAREALNLKILRGQEFYSRLLRSAPWMEDSFPTLYLLRVDSSG